MAELGRNLKNILQNINFSGKAEEDDFDRQLQSAVVKNQHISVFERLFDKYPQFINKQIYSQENHFTPLMIAAATNNLKLVDYLLSKCANFSMRGVIDLKGVVLDKDNRVHMATAEEMAENQGFNEIVDAIRKFEHENRSYAFSN